MSDAYTWRSDNRPRASLRLDVNLNDHNVAFTLDEPLPQAVVDALLTFERLAGSLLHRGGDA